MAVTSTTDYSGPYAPDGVTTVFPFDFAALSASEVIALRLADDGTATTLSNFTVTLSPSGGGSVTFVTAPASGDPIYIVSDPSWEQQTNFANQGSMSPKALNAALDRGAVRDLVLAAAISRAALAPPMDTLGVLPAAADRAGKFMAFDADGRASAASGTGADAGLRTDIAASSGAVLVGSSFGGTVQAILNALRTVAEQATAFLTGIKIGDPTLFGFDSSDIARIYRDHGLLATAKHTFRVITASKGDNTAYHPAINVYFEWRDSADVTGSTKGAGTAGFFSVSPRVGRNAVGIDDVVGIAVANTSGVATAKATDAYYLGENPLISGVGNDEWLSGFTCDSRVTYGIQFKYRPSSGQIARFPNNCGIYHRNAANTADLRAIGLDGANYVQLGDIAAVGIDINAPVRTMAFPVSAIVTASTYTVVVGDRNLTFNGACTVTLPAAASFAGRELRLRSVTGAIISASSNVVPLAGGSAGTAILSATGKWAILYSDGAVWQVQAAN